MGPQDDIKDAADVLKIDIYFYISNKQAHESVHNEIFQIKISVKFNIDTF